MVKEGDVLTIEKLPQRVGGKIDFSQILLVGDEKAEKTQIGQPTVKGVKVEAEIIEQGKGPKVRIIKFKPKVRYRRKTGHRQPLTKVKILKIVDSHK